MIRSRYTVAQVTFNQDTWDVRVRDNIDGTITQVEYTNSGFSEQEACAKALQATEKRWGV